MVGPELPDATPGTVGPFRLVIPVVPPADPEGLQLELDDVFIEGARSDGAEAEATVRDDGTRR